MKRIKIIAAFIFAFSISTIGHSQSLKRIISGTWCFSQDLNLNCDTDIFNLNDTINLQQGINVHAGCLGFNDDSTLIEYCRGWRRATVGIGNMFEYGYSVKLGTWEVLKNRIEIFLKNKTKLDCKLEYGGNIIGVRLIVVKRIPDNTSTN